MLPLILFYCLKRIKIASKKSISKWQIFISLRLKKSVLGCSISYYFTLSLTFMHISEDHKYYCHLIGTRGCLVYCVEVACNGLFLIQKHSEEQVLALVFVSIVLDIYFISECTIIIFISIFLIRQFCCCCTDLELGRHVWLATKQFL